MPPQAEQEAQKAVDATSAAFSLWPDSLSDFVLVWLPAIGNLGPLFIFLSALVAIWGIWKNSDTARKRATLDLIEKSESTEYYRTCGSEFRDTLSKPLSKDRMDELIAAKTDSCKKLLRSILDFLNHYELMSIGIRKKALHQHTYKMWMMTTVIKDWNNAAPLIQQLRWRWDEGAECWIYNDKVFANFEHVARKWAKQRRLHFSHISEQTSGPPEKPRGSADEAVPQEDNAECADTTEGTTAPHLWERLKARFR